MGPGLASAMSASTPIEQLPANIPCLEPSGINWAIFSMRFREAMKATRRWGYFDGTKSHPEPKDKGNVTDDETEAIEKWDHEDLVARYLLSQHLPDTTAICLSHYKTAKERWEKVNHEFMAKSMYMQKDLEQSFFEMRCAKGADVRCYAPGSFFFSFTFYSCTFTSSFSRPRYSEAPWTCQLTPRIPILLFPWR